MVIKDKLLSLLAVQIVIVVALSADCYPAVGALDVQEAGRRDRMEQMTFLADQWPLEAFHGRQPALVLVDVFALGVVVSFLFLDELLEVGVSLFEVRPDGHVLDDRSQF